MIYDFAGLKIEINVPYDGFEIFANKYISKEGTPDLVINVNQNDIDLEKTDNSFSNEYLQTVAVLRKLANIFPTYNRLLMHGATIEYEGNGYLFTAPSGTGKTTHIRLWKKYLQDKVKIVNGDKPFIIDEEQVLVCGSPWAGKENYHRNVIVPLKGICYIKRGKENRISKLETKQAINYLMKQIYFPKNKKEFLLAMDIFSDILKKVDIYLLECDMSKEAFLTSYEMMTKNKYF